MLLAIIRVDEAMHVERWMISENNANNLHRNSENLYLKNIKPSLKNIGLKLFL